MDSMKLDSVYNFLEENRQYNRALQEKAHLNAIGNTSSNEDKLINILYNTVNTQSRPKIDKISKFFQSIYQNKSCLDSLGAFIKFLHNGDNVECNYDSLFHGLKKSHGWGPKTSALFVKNIYHFHNNEYTRLQKIWSDAPCSINHNDRLYLPVDAVITAIFNKIEPGERWTFKSINDTLFDFNVKQESKNSIEVWDDLWFWGFFNQKGGGKDRKFEWNENKYWALKITSKESRDIEDIKNKSQCFRNKLLN